MAEPLAPYRVLDLSWGIAGPIGTMLLAEQGAEVIKVEPPGGDPFRKLAGYPVWNRSKKSIVLDLKNASDRDVFLFLVDDTNPIEAGRLPDGSPDLYFRGFYCWNSGAPRVREGRKYM